MSDSAIHDFGLLAAIVISALIAWLRSLGAEKQISEIHVIVNNQRSEMVAKIDAQRQEILDLRARIDDLKK